MAAMMKSWGCPSKYPTDSEEDQGALNPMPRPAQHPKLSDRVSHMQCQVLDPCCQFLCGRLPSARQFQRQACEKSAVHDKEMSRGPSGFLLYRLLQNRSTHVTWRPCVISWRMCSCARATRLTNGNTQWSRSPLPRNSSRCSLVNGVTTPLIGTVSTTFIGFASSTMK